MSATIQHCPNCGAENLAVSRFCDQCGSPLPAKPANGDAPAPAAGDYARLVAGCATDKGRVRENNEDRVSIEPLADTSQWEGKPLGLYLVADGMGGTDRGELASTLAVESMARTVRGALAARDAPSATEPDWGIVLKHAAQSAHREVTTARQAEASQMGTTLVGALVAGYDAFILNVGDSRAYHLSANAMRRLTHDDSVVQMLVDSGQIGEAEIRTHPQRNIILRYLGQPEELPVETGRVNLAPGDSLLLCSDGLWEMVLDPEIERTVRTAATPAQACEQLVAAANANGGGDNISVVLVQLSRDQEV